MRVLLQRWNAIKISELYSYQLDFLMFHWLTLGLYKCTRVRFYSTQSFPMSTGTNTSIYIPIHASFHSSNLPCVIYGSCLVSVCVALWLGRAIVRIYHCAQVAAWEAQRISAVVFSFHLFNPLNETLGEQSAVTVTENKTSEGTKKHNKI